jgi:ribosome biogenesis GTPase
LLQARICAELRNGYRVLHENQEFEARLSGRFRHAAHSRLDLPTVGDEVLIEPPNSGPAIVHELLARRSVLVRKAAGTAYEAQAVAANVDYLLIVCGLDGDFNVRRIERYAALASSGGVEPAIVLNKADLCRDLDVKLLELSEANITAPIHVLAAAFGDGMDSLDPYLRPGTTIALAGSSGAGKSTIANALLGDAVQRTNAVRRGDERGKHTTTARQLFVLPSGAYLIDTPGMRELHLWANASPAARWWPHWTRRSTARVWKTTANCSANRRTWSENSTRGRRQPSGIGGKRFIGRRRSICGSNGGCHEQTRARGSSCARSGSAAA